MEKLIIFSRLKTAHGTLPSPSGFRDCGQASDLAKLCLPQEFRDPQRKLAWTNSICLLFLLVGIVGLKSPRVSTQPPNQAVEIIPVFLVAHKEPQSPDKPEIADNPEPLMEAAFEQPVVVSVSPANASAVAFAVPVAGPVRLVPARLATPGTATNQIAAAPKSTRYIPSTADWGGHPRPEYPLLASRRGYQGTVELGITVAPSGEVTQVQVAQSSGYRILDDAALEHVQRHLRLRPPPGETRRYTLEITFHL